MIKVNFFNGLVAFILLYAAFQYGRVFDHKLVVDQPELNHLVHRELCDVVTDTSGNVYCIWYQDIPYVVDTTVLENQ